MNGVRDSVGRRMAKPGQMIPAFVVCGEGGLFVGGRTKV